MTKRKLIDALNRLDEFASIATEDNDNGEAEQQRKDYKLLFDFIKNTRTTPVKKIKIPFSYSDIQEMYSSPNGEVFDWTFNGVNTIIIKED